MLALMDKDGNGVDEAGYVLKMIEVMELVHSADLHKFKSQFKNHDKDGRGKLNRDNLKAVAAHQKAVADERKTRLQRRRAFWWPKKDTDVQKEKAE